MIKRSGFDTNVVFLPNFVLSVFYEWIPLCISLVFFRLYSKYKKKITSLNSKYWPDRDHSTTRFPFYFVHSFILRLIFYLIIITFLFLIFVAVGLSFNIQLTFHNIRFSLFILTRNSCTWNNLHCHMIPLLN